jgi:uncharacterized protein (DUF983 family)
VVPNKAGLSECPRCRGRMFPVAGTVDSACFTCGNVMYGVIPEGIPPKEPHPAHGGKQLA